MATFIAFLRAVNVGKRQVKMAGLRTELEANGFTDVATFIASGNVRVSTTMRSAAKVEKELEQVMEAWLGFDVPTMVRTPKQLVAIRAIANASGVDAEKRSLELYNCRPEELTKRAASSLIDELKAGRGDANQARRAS